MAGNFLGTPYKADPTTSNAIQEVHVSNAVQTDSTLLSSANASSFTTPSNACTFIIAPTNGGTWKIYAAIPVQMQPACQVAARINKTAGVGTLLNESQAQGRTSSTATVHESMFCQSLYTLTAGQTAIFDFQVLFFQGTGVISAFNGSMKFYIFAERAGA